MKRVSARSGRPAKVTRKARFLDEMEVERIATAPDRYRALMWTLAVGGLRIGERPPCCAWETST